MYKYLIKDTNGNKSLTATAFLVGFLVVNLKLILSGVDLGLPGPFFGEFTGVEYAAALAALGGIYVLRRSGDKPVKSEK